jgi:hypothetical protein
MLTFPAPYGEFKAIPRPLGVVFYFQKVITWFLLTRIKVSLSQGKANLKLKFTGNTVSSLKSKFNFSIRTTFPI